jgi:hypothetical protein
MPTPKLVEIYFYDGPMRGTYKYVPEDELLGRNVYRVVIPLDNTIRSKEVHKYNEVTCSATIHNYLYFKLPYNKWREDNRYVLMLE